MTSSLRSATVLLDGPIRAAERHGDAALHRHRGIDEAAARARGGALLASACRAPPRPARGVRARRRRRDRHSGGFVLRRVSRPLPARWRRRGQPRATSRSSGTDGHPHGHAAHDRGGLRRLGRAQGGADRGRRQRRPGARLCCDRRVPRDRGSPRSGRAPAQGPVRARADLSAGRRRLPAPEDALSDEPARAGDAVPGQAARACRDRNAASAGRTSRRHAVVALEEPGRRAWPARRQARRRTPTPTASSGWLSPHFTTLPSCSSRPGRRWGRTTAWPSTLRTSGCCCCSTTSST